MPKTIKKNYKNTNKKNKTKLDKKKNTKNITKKKHNLSFAQKQKAIKQLKLVIKAHILSIIRADKNQRKQAHLGGGHCSQNSIVGGGNNPNIFTSLWKAFKRAIQKILKALGFSRKESVGDTDAISNNIEVFIFNHNQATNKLTSANKNAMDKEMNTTGKPTITLDEVNKLSDELAERFLHKRFPAAPLKRYSDSLKALGNNHVPTVVNKFVVHPHPKDGKPSFTL